MSDIDLTDLLERITGCINNAEYDDEQETLTDAFAVIEAQAAEIERLTINGIHTCHDECQRVPCMQRREIKHLKDILEIWITNYQRLNGLKHDDARAYAKAWMFRNANGEEPK